MEDIGNVLGCCILLQKISDEFIAIFSQCLGCNRFIRCRSQLNENLVLHAKVPESQTTFVGRIGLRQELGDVFLVLHLGTKVHEYDGAENEQPVHQCFLLFEEAIDCDEKFVHVF